MRPRKVILLVNANEAQLGMQRYMLETRGYRVLVAQDAAAALALHDLGVDLVLGLADGMHRDWGDLARTMKARMPEVPVILVTRQKLQDARFAMAPQADHVYEQASPMELLEWVRMSVARKRGPRKIALLPAVPAMAGD